MREGERFDRYVIEALLGRGGMGEVYRAYDERLRRRVALKLLSPNGAALGPAAMLREARAAAALHHPNAVAVYDVAEAGGRPYLTMELLKGRPLRALVGADGVPLGARLRWLRQAAAVLSEAHKLGIIHRDVKPENIFVCDDGLLKLLDFGIAKRVQAEGPPSAARPAGPGRWGQSDLVGTPLYMAPEHRLGGRADARSDQFAWGVVAFELLTGRHPRVLEGEPRERLTEALVACGVSAQVAEIVTRAFLLMPETRFASMAELLASWDAASTAQPPAAPPAPPSPPGPGVVAPPGGADASPGPGGAAPSGSGGAALRVVPAASEHQRPDVRGHASEAGGRSWRRKFGRSASDTELAVLVGGLFLALGLGGTLVVNEVRAGRLVPAFASSAGAASKSWGCTPEGSEQAIVEGVLDGPATSLLTLGGRAFAYAAVKGPGGGPVDRALRLQDGRWQPFDVARKPGFEPSSSRAALSSFEGDLAFFMHNERAFYLGGFEAALDKGPFSMFVPGYDVHTTALAEWGTTTGVVTLGRGGRHKADDEPAAKAVIVRKGCGPQGIDLKVERPRLEPGAPPGGARLAPPLVALDGGKLAAALPRDDATFALSIIEYDAECGMARFGKRTALPISPPSAIALHRGELYWASAAGDAVNVGGLGGPVASLRGKATADDPSLASVDGHLALAWVDGAEGPGRVMAAGLRPGGEPPSPFMLAEGAGLRDVHVRPLPDGRAFVSWVKGSSMRGRALRCGAP